MNDTIENRIKADAKVLGTHGWITASPTWGGWLLKRQGEEHADRMTRIDELYRKEALGVGRMWAEMSDHVADGLPAIWQAYDRLEWGHDTIKEVDRGQRR